LDFVSGTEATTLANESRKFTFKQMLNLFKPLLLLNVVFFSVHVLAQNPGNKKPRSPEDYQLRTLEDIYAMKPDPDDLRDKQDRILVTRDVLPSRVLVTFSGSSRPISTEKKEIIRQWARLYAGSMEHYIEPYQTEMRFTENGISYWLAMPSRKQTFTKGKKLALYLIRLGAGITGEKYDWTLLVENVE
jgi:hypothetical protein